MSLSDKKTEANYKILGSSTSHNATEFGEHPPSNSQNEHTTLT